MNSPAAGVKGEASHIAYTQRGALISKNTQARPRPKWTVISYRIWVWLITTTPTPTHKVRPSLWLDSYRGVYLSIWHVCPAAPSSLPWLCLLVKAGHGPAPCRVLLHNILFGSPDFTSSGCGRPLQRKCTRTANCKCSGHKFINILWHLACLQSWHIIIMPSRRPCVTEQSEQ